MVGYRLSAGDVPLLEVKNHREGTTVSFNLKIARRVARLMLHALDTRIPARQGPPSFVQMKAGRKRKAEKR